MFQRVRFGLKITVLFGIGMLLSLPITKCNFFFNVVCHYSVWLFQFCFCLSLFCLSCPSHLSDPKSHFPLLFSLSLPSDLLVLVVSTLPTPLLVLHYSSLSRKCLFQSSKVSSAASPASLVPPALLTTGSLLPSYPALDSRASALFSC